MKKRVLAVVMCALMAGTAFTGFKDAGTGICAHESAMKGGEVITIPRFE